MPKAASVPELGTAAKLRKGLQRGINFQQYDRDDFWQGQLLGQVGSLYLQPLLVPPIYIHSGSPSASPDQLEHSLEHSVGEIQDIDLCNEGTNGLDIGLMGRVGLDIIVPVRGRCELGHQAVGQFTLLELDLSVLAAHGRGSSGA